jgi:hypothetical protein
MPFVNVGNPFNVTTPEEVEMLKLIIKIQSAALGLKFANTHFRLRNIKGISGCCLKKDMDFLWDFRKLINELSCGCIADDIAVVTEIYIKELTENNGIRMRNSSAQKKNNFQSFFCL